MSVDHSACIGYGYLVPKEKIDQILDQEEFYNSEYLTSIDAYHCDSAVFFGLMYKTLDEGESCVLPTINSIRSCFEYQEVYDMISEYKHFFPNESNYSCEVVFFAKVSQEII